jgi:hypothetical protein
MWPIPERQLLNIATRMGRDKIPLVVARAVEGVKFVGSQGRFKTRISCTLD